MSKELCEIIEYLQENYREDYAEILSILKGVHEKIKDEIKRCVDEDNYNSKTDELMNYVRKFKMIDFEGIVIKGENDSHSQIENKEKNYILNEDEVLLSLADTWTKYIPVRFVFGDKNEMIFSNWKKVYVGVLRELHRRDCKTFEDMVINNTISSRQSQKHLFSQKKNSSEYAQIPNTGYFYMKNLSPEQMRVNLQKIFSYFKIDPDDFKVFVDGSRKRKSKGVRNEEVIITDEDVVYLMDKSKRCPICATTLNPTSKSYSIYEDENKFGESWTEKTYIKRCEVCKKEFMTKETFLTLQKQKDNFEKRINFKIIK